MSGAMVLLCLQLWGIKGQGGDKMRLLTLPELSNSTGSSLVFGQVLE